MKVLDTWLAASPDRRVVVELVAEQASTKLYTACAMVMLHSTVSVKYLVGGVGKSTLAALQKLDDALSSEAGKLLSAERKEG